MLDARELVAKNLHFVGRKGFKIDQTPEDKEFIREIDAAIDREVAKMEMETGAKITLTEGERYQLRWECLRGLLIRRGCDPAELDAMAEAARKATDEAIAEHEKRVDGFKIAN